MRPDPLFVWLAALAVISGIFYIVCLHAGAATLSISGSAVGNGSQVFSVTGENITAFWNGTAWNVTGAF